MSLSYSLQALSSLLRIAPVLRWVPVALIVLLAGSLAGCNFAPGMAAYTPPTVEKAQVPEKTETALFAGGCFWGVEYHMRRLKGVVSTRVGYTGGKKEKPRYEDLHEEETGHAEAVEVIYDPSKTNYETVAKLFFEIHDPTQVRRQGPAVGDQYRSAVFYSNDEQKQTAEKLIGILKEKGYKVATQVVPAGKFWPAEEYHQQYYDKEHGTPYCHVYKKRF